jgi:flagellar basal-body rod modification protein FlgD
MTVTATAPTTTTPTTSSTSSTDVTSLGRTSLAQNFDMFLTLLTAQMKNQDPLSPLDNNQFTSQLVQMTGVEQQLATNDLLKTLVANTGASLTGAVDLIGKQVQAQSADAKLSSGSAQWTYSLDSDTNNLKVEVLDSSGKTVDVVAPTADQSSAGTHTFTWDGKNLAGVPQPDGIYTLRLTTQDSSGNSVSAGTIYVNGVVSGVEQSNGQTMITINGAQIPLGQVTSVAPVAASSSSGASSNTTNPADQTSAATA